MSNYLGITAISKVFSLDIPLGHVNYADFIDLVVQRDLRPERPDDEDAPMLSDALWQIAENCWTKDPKDRPTATALCDKLSRLLDKTVSVRSPQHIGGHIDDPKDSPTPHTLPNTLPHPPDTTTAVRSASDPSQPHLTRTIQTSLAQLLTVPPNLTIQAQTGRFWCATFSPDGKYIVSGSREGAAIQIWDAQTGDCILTPPQRHYDNIWCVALSPDGRHIASGSVDHTILVWDASMGTIVSGPFTGHTRAVSSVCFSPDGTIIASGGKDNKVRLWNAQTGFNIFGSLKGHSNAVTSVVFSRDGKRIASGSDDKTVRVWDAKSGRLLWGPLRRHQSNIRFVAFSPSGKRMVSADVGGDVCVWNLNTGTLISGPSKQHAKGILVVAFTPSSAWFTFPVSSDGKWIAGRNANAIHIWDSKTGRLMATLEGHTDSVTSIAFSSDNKRVLSTSNDKTIRVHSLDC